MTAWRRLWLWRRPVRFCARQDGGATAFGLIVICMLLLIAGVAIDVANLYRYKTLLQLTADSAAQAGVVTLARGGVATDAHSAAGAMVETNMPEGQFGQVITNSAREVQVLHYDAATGTLGQVGDAAPANAVLVQLQRSEATGNPVPTFLMGMAGIDAWSLVASSVATLMPTQRCGNAEGIVARGAVNLGLSPVFGSDFCLHSQSSITLPIGTRMADQLRVSLPDPSDCAGVCKPGNSATKTEPMIGQMAEPMTGPTIRPVALNLVMPGAQDHVARLVAGFLDPQTTLPEETAFFATRPLAGDPEALREVGMAADDLRPGDVLQVTPLQFSQMRERPAGLVYAVRCDTAKNDRRALWERTLTLTGVEQGPTLRDLVLITDCAIEMDDRVRIEGALILLTGPQGAQISALPGATLGGTSAIGDTDAACDAARRVRLMTFGNLVLPAGLAGANVSAVAGGDITLAADPDQERTQHRGLILHAGGRVTAMGSHSFARCPAETTSDPLMPAMQVIAHVMPPLGPVLAPPLQKAPAPQTDLPGQAIERLPGDTAEPRAMNGTLRPGS